MLLDQVAGCHKRNIIGWHTTVYIKFDEFYIVLQISNSIKRAIFWSLQRIEEEYLMTPGPLSLDIAMYLFMESCPLRFTYP